MEFHNKETDLLVKAFLSLKTEKEMYAFLEDICTINEILDMGQRLKVASCLAKKMNYQQIVAETGVSSATISRISKCLIYGDGYKNALMRIKEENDD